MPVSIPRRDFWVFQPSLHLLESIRQGVSIPRRDFWVFQPRFGISASLMLGFQSLEGIFGFFNLVTEDD
ncbi:hypothetical protein CKA32_000703 [Geitlerinema sp. FC II]|nr:hypothetical protein CKA32_000703 [Geitlerinema sp. FC II]